VFTARNLAAMIGPGLVMGAAAIGGGEWLMGPSVTARYGGALFWLSTLSILGQVIYNIEISRYTLYCGEPIFTGKFRTLPGPMFWLVVYLILDAGSVFPYLASTAATPLAGVILRYIPDQTHPQVLATVGGTPFTDIHLLKGLGFAIFLLAMVPLIFGGKIYNSVRVVMTFKLAVVFGYLLFVAAFFSDVTTWSEILSGFVKVGSVPVERAEDANQNGILDPGEDYDGDGRLDPVEEKFTKSVDSDGDGKPDAYPDVNGDGKQDKFRDVDGDGQRDGANVDNFLVSLWEGRGFPVVDLSVLGLLCAMVAISGQGGLSNTPISNYTRDQGWGMGKHVGAIPSVVGGHHLQLSHVGMVFRITSESLTRWKAWYRHVARDQLALWMPACFIGLALPSVLSVQFLQKGTEADQWTAAGMTAGRVGETVGLSWGEAAGGLFWFMTLFCGFLVLAPTMVSTADGIVRRWVDVFWTSSLTLRRLDTRAIRKVYFSVLCAYIVFGFIVLAYVPGGDLLQIASNIYNYALGFSCLHTLVINTTLLPKELRPGPFVRVGLVLAGLYFIAVAVVTNYATFRTLGWI
jgi:hypothetical protein